VRLIARLTPQQLDYLARIRCLVASVDLSLYRYVDFTCISEARWTFINGHARLVSSCLRQLPADQFDLARNDMNRLVRELGTKLGFDCIVDCTIELCGRVRVLEVNPFESRRAGGPTNHHGPASGFALERQCAARPGQFSRQRSS
jgi:hypothetical protein